MRVRDDHAREELMRLDAGIEARIKQEVERQVGPLSATLRDIADSQRGTARAVQGRIDALQRSVAQQTIQIAGLASAVESAAKDANAARVDVNAVMELVGQVQAAQIRQRDAVVELMKALAT